MSESASVSRGVELGLGVRVRNLRHVYHMDGAEVVALRGANLTVRPGESLALLGPSGSGKSTLLSAIAGLLRPTTGQLYVGPDEVTAMSERELLAFRSARIGIVLQNPGRNLLPYGSAEDNVRFAQRPVAGYRRSQLPSPDSLLRQLGLADLAGPPVATMSGGEQQRLSVAIAMASLPGLLLADEPTSQLDRASRDRVVAMLEQVTTLFGTTVMAVTHDRAVSSAFERVVTVADGVLHEPRGAHDE